MNVHTAQRASAFAVSLVADGARTTLDMLPDIAVQRHQAGSVLSGLADTVVVDIDLSRRDFVMSLRDTWARFGKPERLVFVVDRADHFAVNQANALGAHALLHPPFDARVATRALFPEDDSGVPAQVRLALKSGSMALEALFLGLLAGGAVAADEVDRASAATDDALTQHGIDAWLDAVRQHHSSTFQHCLIVTGIIANFARSAGMSQRDVVTLTTAGFLHDVGKIRVPLAILDKPTGLTVPEFEAIKLHPAIGFDYLKNEPLVSGDVLASVRHHHEYLDGSGYPDGIQGGAIGDITRIVTICDIYGALVEDRSYKAAMEPAGAMAVLTDMARTGKVEGALVRALARSVGLDPA